MRLQRKRSQMLILIRILNVYKRFNSFIKGLSIGLMRIIKSDLVLYELILMKSVRNAYFIVSM